MLKRIAIIALAIHTTSLCAVTVINKSSRFVVFNQFDFHKARIKTYPAAEIVCNPITAVIPMIPEKDTTDDWYVSPWENGAKHVQSMTIWMDDKNGSYTREVDICDLDNSIVLVITENQDDGSILIEKNLK